MPKPPFGLGYIVSIIGNCNLDFVQLDCKIITDLSLHFRSPNDAKSILTLQNQVAVLFVQIILHQPITWRSYWYTTVISGNMLNSSLKPYSKYRNGKPSTSVPDLCQWYQFRLRVLYCLDFESYLSNQLNSQALRWSVFQWIPVTTQWCKGPQMISVHTV